MVFVQQRTDYHNVQWLSSFYSLEETVGRNKRFYHSSNAGDYERSQCRYMFLIPVLLTPLYSEDNCDNRYNSVVHKN